MRKKRDDCELGRVGWHCSDKDGGPDVGISIGLGDKKMLWFGEISDDIYAEGEDDAKALGSNDGWWVVVYPSRLPVAKFVNQLEAQEFISEIEAMIGRLRKERT